MDEKNQNDSLAWREVRIHINHKPAGIPAKADGAKQAAWITWYENLKKSLRDNEKILFQGYTVDSRDHNM